MTCQDNLLDNENRKLKILSDHLSLADQINAIKRLEIKLLNIDSN